MRRSARCSRPATPAARAAASLRSTSTQELARLTAPLIDPELRGEIRDLVIARNKRRERLGKPPLDVEAEIEREIAGLTDL